MMKFRQDFNSLFSENQTDLITGSGFRRVFSKIAPSVVNTIRTVWSTVISHSTAFYSVDGIHGKFIYTNKFGLLYLTTSFDRSHLQVTCKYMYIPHTNYYYGYRYRYYYRYYFSPPSMIINVNWTCQHTRTVSGFVVRTPFNLHTNWSLIYHKTNCSRTRGQTIKPNRHRNRDVAENCTASDTKRFISIKVEG